jgi:hypothetical protein
MKTTDFYDSKYLAAADLGGKLHTVTIAGVEAAEFTNEGVKTRKPVLLFQNRKKGLTLNKTNTKKLQAVFSVEMDAWIGKQIEIYPDQTDMGGRMVDCIGVRAVVPKAEASGQDWE